MDGAAAAVASPAGRREGGDAGDGCARGRAVDPRGEGAAVRRSRGRRPVARPRDRAVPAVPRRRGSGRGAGRRRHPGVHARHAPCLRRRPPRGHRRHDPPDAAAWSPTGRRRLLLRHGALHDRAGPRAPRRLRRNQRVRGTAGEPEHRRGPGGDDVPRAGGLPQLAGPPKHRRAVGAPARRAARRGRAGANPLGPRPDQPPSRRPVPRPDPLVLAHVPRGAADGARPRDGQRGDAARAQRLGRGVGHVAAVRRPVAAPAVRGRHERVRHR